MADTAYEDEAPTADTITDYDIAHAPLYIRLMDAEAAGLDWRIIAMLVFEIDVDQEPGRARRVVESHLARALWLRDEGYKGLLGAKPPR